MNQKDKITHIKELHIPYSIMVREILFKKSSGNKRDVVLKGNVIGSAVITKRISSILQLKGYKVIRGSDIRYNPRRSVFGVPVKVQRETGDKGKTLSVTVTIRAISAEDMAKKRNIIVNNISALIPDIDIKEQTKEKFKEC